MSTNPAFSRRHFISRGVVLASTAFTVPWFIDMSARVLAAQPGNGQSSRPGIPDERILVVVQLAGGNDGLNTVVPYADASYYKARPVIGIPEAKVLKLKDNDFVGLHPKLQGLKDLYDSEQLAVIQGVGYPNPNRSHFKSMDIWQTADTTGTGEGWIGRYFDCRCNGAQPKPGAQAGANAATTPGALTGDAGIALGRNAPLAMQGRIFRPTSFETPELFRWTGLDVDKHMEEPYHEIARTEHVAGLRGGDSSAAFLMRTALDAQLASDNIRKAVERKPTVQYPGTPLAKQLAMVASMIAAGLKTRVYYVTLGGFDTHSAQGNINGTQANLLDQVGSAIKAFYDDLKSQDNDRRVLTMTFSEFGRRVAQNGSNGTDHGTAAPMFLAGPMVRPGVLGNHPSLTDLDAGDLKFTVDFRTVYAGILQQWLKADPDAVLQGKFQAAKVVRA